jgi:hypothetical protein
MGSFMVYSSASKLLVGGGPDGKVLLDMHVVKGARSLSELSLIT